MGLACIHKGEDSTHPCPQRTAVNQACDLRQVPSCDIYEKEGRVDPMTLRKLLIGLGHSGNQLTVAPQDLERALLRFTADQIENGIHISSRVLEAFGLKINHRVCAEFVQVGEIVLSGRGNGPNSCASG